MLSTVRRVIDTTTRHTIQYNTIQCISLESVVYNQEEVSATADHWSRGLLPNVACRSVIAEPQQ